MVHKISRHKETVATISRNSMRNGLRLMHNKGQTFAGICQYMHFSLQNLIHEIIEIIAIGRSPDLSQSSAPSHLNFVRQWRKADDLIRNYSSGSVPDSHRVPC